MRLEGKTGDGLGVRAQLGLATELVGSVGLEREAVNALGKSDVAQHAAREKREECSHDRSRQGRCQRGGEVG